MDCSATKYGHSFEEKYELNQIMVIGPSVYTNILVQLVINFVPIEIWYIHSWYGEMITVCCCNYLMGSTVRRVVQITCLHFTNNKFKCIFVNENVRISILISLKFLPKGPIDNKSALVQVIAWHQTGDKPLPKTMLTQFTDAYMRH